MNPTTAGPTGATRCAPSPRPQQGACRSPAADSTRATTCISQPQLRRHVQQPDRVVRPGLLAGPRPTSTASGGSGSSSIPTPLPADLDAVLTPWNYTIRDTLDMHALRLRVREVHALHAGRARRAGRPLRVEADRRPGGRARERSIAPKCACTACRSLPRSCFIRVFLNLPDANAATPLDHPNYAGYLAVFGHGACYGGPGPLRSAAGRARASTTCARAATTRRAITAST